MDVSVALSLGANVCGSTPVLPICVPTALLSPSPRNLLYVSQIEFIDSAMRMILLDIRVRTALSSLRKEVERLCLGGFLFCLAFANLLC